MESILRFGLRSLTLVIASACALGTFPTQVHAAPAVDPNEITEPGIQLVQPGVIALEHAPTPETAPELTVINVNDMGQRTMEKIGLDPDQPTGWQVESAAAAAASGFSCVKSTNKRYLYAGNPVTLAGSNNKYQYRWQVHPYTHYYARVVNGRNTWQFEACTLGGFEGQNGYRSRYNASTIATESNKGNQRIGLSSDSGSNQSTASATLSFQVAAGPVSISGSLPTNTDGSMFGHYGQGQYRSHVDQYNKTQSTAGWRSGCNMWRWCGSPHMQTNVHHALFEFNHGSERKFFPFDVNADLYCSHPYGVGCG